MTDQELIKALREDAPRIGWLGWGRPNDVGKKMADAADRLEALLAEVQIQICKRSEIEREIGRLEVERDHFRDLTKKMWCEKQYGEDTNVPTKRISKYAGLQGMTAAQWNAHGPQPIYCGDLPCVMTHDEEPPSTEGVE